jgi:pimeloyl-ACP methyl ester carboxylesterase
MCVTLTSIEGEEADMTGTGTTRTGVRRVRTRLGELQVRTTGEPSELPTVVLWPSMFVDHHTFDRLLPLLPGRRLVAVDGPGLGGSDPLDRPSSVTEAADAAAELLTGPAATELGIDGPVDWVGNAFGGHVGYELAVRSGLLRSLVSVSAPPEALPPALRRQVALLLPLLRVLGPVGPVRSAILGNLLSDTSAADPATRQVVLDSVARPTRRSLALAVRSFIAERQDVTGLLPALTLPCLFVAGGERGDWSAADARRAASLAPGATAVVVEGASTLVPLEQPAALAAELERFWGGLTA